MVNHCDRHQRIYVTNQLMDTFYVLSGLLIEKCSVYVSCQSNPKSDVIDQVTLGDQYFSDFKATFFWLDF